MDWKQMCGSTGRCYVCSGVANVRNLAECMTENVKIGAYGLSQAVLTHWAQGDRDHKETVKAMYDSLVTPDNATQRMTIYESFVT
mgnify:CR=1 FL=1